MREYVASSNFGEWFTADDFASMVADKSITSEDGSGYWAKGTDDAVFFCPHSKVFSTPRKDATHVFWFDK